MGILWEVSLSNPPPPREVSKSPSKLEFGRKSEPNIFTSLTWGSPTPGDLGRPPLPLKDAPPRFKLEFGGKRASPFVCYKKGISGYREGGETQGPRDGNICSVLMWGAAQLRVWDTMVASASLRTSNLPPPAVAAGMGEGGEGGGHPQFCFPTPNPR